MTFPYLLSYTSPPERSAKFKFNILFTVCRTVGSPPLPTTTPCASWAPGTGRSRGACGPAAPTRSSLREWRPWRRWEAPSSGSTVRTVVRFSCPQVCNLPMDPHLLIIYHSKKMYMYVIPMKYYPSCVLQNCRLCSVVTVRGGTARRPSAAGLPLRRVHRKMGVREGNDESS